jgi:hypothetical protein
MLLGKDVLLELKVAARGLGAGYPRYRSVMLDCGLGSLPLLSELETSDGIGRAMKLYCRRVTGIRYSFKVGDDAISE